MKIKYSIISVALLTLCACEPLKDIYDEIDATPKDNVAKYNIEYLDKVFTEENPASATLPAWLKSNYYGCGEGSMATVKYQLEETVVTESVLLEEDFERDIVSKGETVLPGWENKIESGKGWYDKAFSGNTYTELSANGAKEPLEAWLITPSIVVKEGMTLSFDLCYGYFNGECFSVKVSKLYNGKNFDKAEWKDITELIPNEIEKPGSGYGTLANVGLIPLDGYVGKNVHIAFVYKGDATATPKVTSTVQLDNIVVHNADEVKKVVTTGTDEYKYESNEWKYVRTIKQIFREITMDASDYELVFNYVEANFDQGFIDTRYNNAEYYYGANFKYKNWDANGSTRMSYYNVGGYLDGKTKDEANAICMERIKEGILKFIDLKYPELEMENGSVVGYKVTTAIRDPEGTTKTHIATIVYDEIEKKYVMESLEMQ